MFGLVMFGLGVIAGAVMWNYFGDELKDVSPF